MSPPVRTVAIIGASSDRRKYGNKAVRAFASRGWRVFPVNPKEVAVEGLHAFGTLDELTEPVELVSLYVPAEVGRKLLPEIAALRPEPREVWFNPGAESAELKADAARLKLRAVYGCSIVAYGASPHEFPDA